MKKPNQTKNQKLMKTTFSIIVAFFGLQSNLILANGGNAQALFTDNVPAINRETHTADDGVPPANLFFIRALVPVIPSAAMFEDEELTAELSSLSPDNPKEADFSDSDLVPESSPAIHSLAPITPAEADFNDSDGGLNPAMLDLAPLTPKEADFMDTEITVSSVNASLAPAVPDKAEFEDHV